MQQDQNFNFEVSSKVEVVSQCSCAECDSASCFLKRRANELCAYASRAPSGLHTHSSQSSKLVTEAKRSISKLLILPQEQIVPDIKKQRVKSSVNVITRQIITELVKETNKNDISDSTTTIFKISNTSFSQGQGNSRNTSSFIKDSRKESKKDKGSNVYCYRKKAYREGKENVNLPKDTACQNMSAAVEHSMLHQELQAPIPKAKISSTKLNLSAAEIYNKIKEAYKACNCEVCECVVGKSLQNEFCACKPCECDGCASLSECTLNYIGTEVIQKHAEQCFCLLCDKRSCKISDNLERKLQGGHHENFESRKFGKGCDCKQCESNKCKARSNNRTLIVAPVGGELQSHIGCRCAPCECFECSHRYGVTTNGQHEISTGVNRHPNCHCEVCDNEACIPDNNQSCRCVRQSKVMSKPVEQDSHDYDIRTAHVTYNNKGICKSNFETLAMFAALPSSYTKRIDQSKQCNCDHCECLNCEYVNCTNSQNEFQSPRKSHQLDRELYGNFQYGKPEFYKQLKHEDRCGLGMCDCINCDNNTCVEDKKATKKLNNKCDSNHIIYDCNICEFVECENTKTDYFKNRGEDVDIIRLVKSRRKTLLRNYDSLIQSCIDTLESNKKIFQQHELSIHSSKSSTSVDNFGESHHPTCHQVCYGSHRIFCPNFETDSVVHEHVSESANEKDHRSNNMQTLNSSHSLLFSKSFVKESEHDTPVTSKLKSRESSCNSSGYDYPDYLAHFPKFTIKTCYNNVIQCDLGNKVMLNVGSNNKIVTKNSHVSVSDRKSFQSLTITARSSNNTKVNYKASPTFDYDIQKNISQIRNLTKETCKTYMLSQGKVNPETQFDKFKTDSASSITTNTTFNEEYIRVQKTLQDAREYSQHLVSLFEKYEKANQEFESISERIKNSTYSIDPNTNKNVNQTIQSKDTFVIQEVPTKDSECTFKSAFDEIDSINKQENYIENRASIHSLEKPINILMIKNITHNDGGIQTFAYKDPNHTITEEKHSLDAYKQKRSIVKKLNKSHIKETKRAKNFVTAQKSISQLNKLDDKQGVFTVINDSDIVVSSDRQSLCSHKHFQKLLDTKVIATDKKTDEDCHGISNLSQGNIFENLEQDKIRKSIEERESVTVKKDYHEKISTTFSKNLSNQCSAELNNLSIRKSTVETKAEKIKLLKDDDFPIKNMEMNSDNVQQEKILSLPPSDESNRKAATEVISPQPIYEHATNMNKNKELKGKSIVKRRTECSELLLDNVDTDKNSGNFKHEEISSLPPPRESDGETATEVISHQLVDEHCVSTSKALEKVQTEVKRLLDLPFLQVVKNRKSNHDKNCEAMKVTTLIAQRISDHSVAVKWKAPSLFTNVKGYEVLIDGRFVQKITNPSRRMAVISCLPHADKVLLTVRTVVAVPITDHYPAATLVYHTRKKSETLMQSRNSYL